MQVISVVFIYLFCFDLACFILGESRFMYSVDHNTILVALCSKEST